MRKYVKVRFPSSMKEYSFFTRVAVAKGDLVICNTVNGITLATATCTSSTKVLPEANNWVLQVVDVNEMIMWMDKQKRADRINVEMDRRLAELKSYKNEDTRMAELESYAKSDVKLKALLTEYNTLFR